MEHHNNPGTHLNEQELMEHIQQEIPELNSDDIIYEDDRPRNFTVSGKRKILNKLI